MSHCNQAFLFILCPGAHESDTDARRNQSWPDWLRLGQIGLNFLLNDSGFELDFTNIFENILFNIFWKNLVAFL